MVSLHHLVSVMDIEANPSEHAAQQQQQQQQQQQSNGSRWSIASQTSRLVWDWLQDSGYRLLRFILCIVFLCIIPTGYSDVRKILVRLANISELESNASAILNNVQRRPNYQDGKFSE